MSLTRAPFLAASATIISLGSLAADARAQAPRQSCDTVSSSTTAAQLSGARIKSIDARPSKPSEVGRFGSAAARLHFTTRARTIERDMRLSPGDTVDTIAVGEGMRRLRQNSYVASARIIGVRCEGDSTVALTILTQDRWTLLPTIGAQSNSSYGGVEERNLFGTGRAGSILLASRQGKLGGAIGLTDPYFLGLPVYLRFRGARYSDGDEARIRLRNAEESVLDEWHPQLILATYRADNTKTQQFGGYPVLVEQAFQRSGAFLLVGRRIGEATTSATSILFGADFERAFLNVPDNALTVGPKLVERRYHGLTVGLGRKAVAFDTVSWIGSRQLLIDVPLGFEMEGLLGGGREDVAQTPAAFGSIWAGRMWIPGPRQLASVDFWSSGYRIAGQFDAASTRTLLSYYARRGTTLITIHGAVEKLVNPDPDVRALSMYDPTIALIPETYRLSENAAAAEIEASRHLLPLLRSLGVDGAVFAATSLRRSSPLSQSDHFDVTAIGTGLRLVPTTQGSGWLRLDLLYPVVRSEHGRHGPTFAISVAPWLQANRQRDDPRIRQ